MPKATSRSIDDTALGMVYRALKGCRPMNWQPDADVVQSMFNIRHGLDLWHKSRKISAKVAAAAQSKNCIDLAPWVPAVRNHLWWCAQNCNGSSYKLKVNGSYFLKLCSNRLHNHLFYYFRLCG